MQNWNPRSYIAEALGVAQHRKNSVDNKDGSGGEHTLPSFYDFTVRHLQRKNTSDQIAAALNTPTDEQFKYDFGVKDNDPHVTVLSTSPITPDAVAAAGKVDFSRAENGSAFTDFVLSIFNTISSLQYENVSEQVQYAIYGSKDIKELFHVCSLESTLFAPTSVTGGSKEGQSTEESLPHKLECKHFTLTKGKGWLIGFRGVAVAEANNNNNNNNTNNSKGEASEVVMECAGHVTESPVYVRLYCPSAERSVIYNTTLHFPSESQYCRLSLASCDTDLVAAVAFLCETASVSSRSALLTLLRVIEEKHPDKIRDVAMDFQDGVTLFYDDVMGTTEEIQNGTADTANETGASSTSQAPLTKEGASAPSTRAQPHRVKAVREGNTADAFHLIEARTDFSLLSHLRSLFSALPNASAMCAAVCRDDYVFYSTVESVQFVGTNWDMVCFSISQSSPLHNYVVQTKGNSRYLVMDFLPNASLQALIPEQKLWVPAAETTTVCVDSISVTIHKDHNVFASQCCCALETVSSYQIGDCCLVLAKCRYFVDDQMVHVPIVMPAIGEKAHQETVSVETSQQLCVTPVLCTFVHNVYGAAGFVAYSASICTAHPPTILLNVSEDNASILTENSSDPTLTLHFFRTDQDRFDCSSLDSFDHLPFPISELKRNPDSFTDVFSCIVKTRLIRKIDVSAVHAAVYLLTIFDIQSHGHPFLTRCISR